jgi:hypothetical protein
MKREAACSSNMLVPIYQFTLLSIPEVSNIHWSTLFYIVSLNRLTTSITLWSALLKPNLLFPRHCAAFVCISHFVSNCQAVMLLTCVQQVPSLNSAGIVPKNRLQLLSSQAFQVYHTSLSSHINQHKIASAVDRLSLNIIQLIPHFVCS